MKLREDKNDKKSEGREPERMKRRLYVEVIINMKIFFFKYITEKKRSVQGIGRLRRHG